jgi:hypothetical protein
LRASIWQNELAKIASRVISKTIQKWFVDSDADDLVEWSHR